MTEGEVGIAHGANWFLVGKLTELREVSFGLVRRADYWEYWEYYEPEAGQPIGPRFFEERIEAPSREIAEQSFNAIFNLRYPPTETPTAASKQAVQAREILLGKTVWGDVLKAIAVGDQARAAKVFAAIDAALSKPPSEDDTRMVDGFRKLLAQPKSKQRPWHFLLVSHWDELPSHRGEIALWLERHGSGKIPTATVAQFMLRHASKREVKRKQTTK